MKIDDKDLVDYLCEQAERYELKGNRHIPPNTLSALDCYWLAHIFKKYIEEKEENASLCKIKMDDKCEKYSYKDWWITLWCYPESDGISYLSTASAKIWDKLLEAELITSMQIPRIGTLLRKREKSEALEDIKKMCDNFDLKEDLEYRQRQCADTHKEKWDTVVKEILK